MSYPKKLIEVALPLEEINEACAREKSIRHGHPSTLHLWWARRPLAAARSVIFAQMVDDPSGYVEELRVDADAVKRANRDLRDRLKVWKEKKATHEKATEAGMKVDDPGAEPTLDELLIERERERLFVLIRQLVQWENTTNESVLEPAREEILRSWNRQCHRDGKSEDTPLPAFHDPFAGGGALPLEAQRLGLESYASDLNPVPVMINKAMIEIPPKFAGRPPVNPESRKGQLGTKTWKGAQGLAEDIRYYGQWMREEAEKRIGQLYPKIAVTTEMAEQRPDLQPYIGEKLTVIAWLWARTVKSPNPAFSTVDIPLAASFILSSKAGKEAYVDPVIENGGYRFTIKAGKPRDAEAARTGTKISRGSFKCLMSGSPFQYAYIDNEANAGRMGVKLMAIVAEGTRGRVYLDPSPMHEEIIEHVAPEWKPETPSRGTWASNAQGRIYGFKTFGDYFTPRQLVGLTTFSDLVTETRERIRLDAAAYGAPDDGKLLCDGGTSATAYAEAIAVYLTFGINKLADRGSTICGWDNSRDSLRNTFGRQAIPMVWDFAEANPFSESSGSYLNAVDQAVKVVQQYLPATAYGFAVQDDAQNQVISAEKVISTDPPYYDNIGYADLSDFFYVWMRRSLRSIYPNLFGTLAVPKAEELVACAYRHGSKEKAGGFFLDGMTQAMHRLAEQSHPAFPVTIYYAFKQSESSEEAGTTNTGWDTFLGAVIEAGFAISGTWPMRTELANKISGFERNMLASSIVLVCRKKIANAPMATRREFIQTLQREMPPALHDLQLGNIAPVDLPQSSIGPGMAIFTRYSKVVESDGSSMSVRKALQLINASVDEFLSAQESQMDDWTRFAVTWFSQHAWAEGIFGDALNLATARNISVEGVRDAGILESGGGHVRLYRASELPAEWDPMTDERLTIWEIVHHLIRVMDSGGGERAAAGIIAKVGSLADDVRALCYRLYNICEQKRWADEARAYNTLIVAWPELTRLAQEQARPAVETQADLGV
jgi:putative DNA methylase